MSGQAVPADFSEHMLDLDEDEDLEVFSKVKINSLKTRRTLSPTVPLPFLLRGFDPGTNIHASTFYFLLTTIQR